MVHSLVWSLRSCMRGRVPAHLVAGGGTVILCAQSELRLPNPFTRSPLLKCHVSDLPIWDAIARVVVVMMRALVLALLLPEPAYGLQLLRGAGVARMRTRRCTSPVLVEDGREPEGETEYTVDW